MTAWTKQRLGKEIALGEDSVRQFKAEIPQSVFEELLVNALVHRDYMVSASIRLFVFDNRIEIISPGHLPNNLTVEKIRAGNANIRNPVSLSYVAKGMLPYHGLGSGIQRALSAWSRIDFHDDRDGCLFKVTVHREPVATLRLVDKEALKAHSDGRCEPICEPLTDFQAQLLGLIRSNPSITYDELAGLVQRARSTVTRNIGKLKAHNRLLRVGSRKTGYWEVVE